ncbi:hypothetical protein IWW38_003671 [Coemansia aciculifera]|uniref:Uncharacterized protein n=1 Tax=Coemansia aciculifera TaxID=417176 RepID=A0ACC1M0U7_9FUNG|nr:hypothetical protein IWW38_003671 [Coemansia aciculifera]
MYAQDSEFVAQIVFDTRPRLKGLSSARFVGNAVMTRCLASPMNSLTGGINAQSLAQVALSVRQLVNGVDPQYIGHVLDMLHDDPSCFMCPVSYSLTKTAMFLSNQSRFELYTADFGSGTPVWVSPIRKFVNNFFSILPAPPGTGGYIIYTSMMTQTTAKLMQNKFWMNVADLVY